MRLAATLFFLVVTIVVVGCRATRSHGVQPTSSNDVVDITLYGLVDSPRPPVTLHACILRKTPVDPTSTMKISVFGNVVQSGVFELNTGATLLDAIKTTGGFAPGLSARKVTIKRGEKLYKVQLHYRKAKELPRYEAWYGDERSPSDFVLEPNDVVIVPTIL